MRAPWAAISAGLAVVVVMVAGVKFLGSGQRPDQPAQPVREVQQAPPAPSQPDAPGPQVPKSTQEPEADARKPASPPAKLASLAANPVKPESKPAPPPANSARPATQPDSSAGQPAPPAAKPAQQAQLLPEVQKSAPPSSPPPAATNPAQPPDLPAAPAPAPVQQAAQEPPRAPVRTSPVLLQRTPSPYTDQARRAGLEGAVQLSVDVDDRGIPIRARVLKSLDPGLDRNAIQSLAGWRFQPATEDGKPVGATVKVEVQFSLVGAPGRRIPSLKAKKN